MHKINAIEDYGMIGNTRSGALVSKDGSIDWCCFPRFDSGSIFAELLSLETGGSFKVSPSAPFTSDQRYLPDTNILETTFKVNENVVKLIDCFPVDSEFNKRGELWPYHEILRIIECVSGEVQMMAEFKPRPGYGKKKYKLSTPGKLGLRLIMGNEVCFLRSTINMDERNLDSEKKNASQNFNLTAGQKYFFSMTYSSEAPAVLLPLEEYALDRLDRTVNYWRRWISKCQYQGPYDEQVRRSALMLKLLVYAPSGAVIAAPTTSLPEELGGERNWDYRYCWLRDASFTIRAFVQLGFLDEATAYLNWILHSTSLTRPKLKVLYDVFGETKLPEKKITWFSGYRNSKPVRIGNDADSQFQLDVYGEVINALFIYSPHLRSIDGDTVSFIKDIAEVICRIWEFPDEGIWEVRSGRYHHTHSKAMAWLALDRILKLQSDFNLKLDANKYREVANRIQSEIEEHGFNKMIGSYTRYFDSCELDASLLTLPIMGYRSVSSDRLLTTTLTIKKELSQNVHVFRYRDGHDGISGSEWAFGAGSFWMVEALKEVGLENEAKTLMDELILKSNKLNLWPEEFDPLKDTFLGNYPQAFTHIALIGAALSLQKRGA